ncbi:MAG: nucleotidyltransferase [Catenulispora sp. 13_1_20CM_3_70_7]|nr:MAG: nucleotidyltransferase [Catenulispora sp. 13_1_20CM_3_70_7]
MDRDPVTDARSLVEELFPHAVWAVVTGSVVTAHRTPGSDLDIVVVLPDGDPDAPHRRSRHFRSWPVELFVHDVESLSMFLGKELAGRKPHLHRMVADGIAIVGDPSAQQTHCARVLAAGPAPLSPDEQAAARYSLTDLLDDLASATDPAEKTVIAALTWTRAADNLLAVAGRWPGAGKWQLREMRALEGDMAARWLAARDDTDRIEAFAREVLDRMGGPLFDGYYIPAPRSRDAATRGEER